MLLETYQGAPVIRRQQIFWKAWMVLLFDFLAEPHTITPYAQSGCMRVLYNNILMLDLSTGVTLVGAVLNSIFCVYS